MSTIERKDRDQRVYGRRIELVFTDDPYTDLRPGDRGTVIGSYGGLMDVQWDNGSNLGLLVGIDRWKVIDEEVNDG